ncbi:hypothetical protein [Solidesulfovibrio sp.]|uniref:hypothetical protein n=1 Tax=Solidesulfovibrio sp. TaxID=2910990 RepID=UPI00260F6580|nr:hypothetical protein [Solidesulfovibrio sp.]
MPPSPRHAPTRSSSPLVCLACHGQRLATLLETATLLRLFRPAGEAFAEEAAWPMPEGGLPALAILLSRLEVRLLVCGGATCCCLAPFARLGVAVAPWIAGDVPTVLAALRANRLETLLAPGARLESAHRRCRGFHAIPPENDPS